jgi:hypothetical protein
MFHQCVKLGGTWKESFYFLLVFGCEAKKKKRTPQIFVMWGPRVSLLPDESCFWKVQFLLLLFFQYWDLNSA